METNNGSNNGLTRLALGYGGTLSRSNNDTSTFHSTYGEDDNNDEQTQPQKLRYKTALDDLQKPLIGIQRPIQLSTSVLDRAKSDPSDTTDVATLDRELDHLKQLTKSLAVAEAYMNKYIFTPLAESSEKVSDTIDFHTYLLQQSGKLDDLQHVAQCFVDFFTVRIEDTSDFSAVNPVTLAAEEELSVSVLDKIVQNLKNRFNKKENDQRSPGRARSVTLIHKMREGIKAFKKKSDSSGLQELLDAAQRLEDVILSRMPSKPNKSQILWGRIIDILDNSGGKKIALRLNDILDAATAFAMYSLASGMIAPATTDLNVQQNGVPISMPLNSEGPLEFTPLGSTLTEVTQSQSTSNVTVTGDGAAGSTTDDSPVLNGLIEAGARIYAIRSLQGKYLIVVRTTRGLKRTCVVTTKPGNTRITLGRVPSALLDTARVLESVDTAHAAESPQSQSPSPQQSPSAVMHSDGGADSQSTTSGVTKPVYIPLPPPSETELMSGQGNDTTDDTVATTLFNDRIMMLTEQLKTTSQPNPRTRRVIVITGDKRNASIEFLKARTA